MKQKIIHYTLRAAVLQAIIALVLSAFPFFYGSSGRHFVLSDVVRYFDYASKAMNGFVPYRDYMIEYPIFALPFFLIPRLFTADLTRYAVLFGIEMLLINAATVYLVASHARIREGIKQVPARLIWYTLFFLSLCPLTIARFDLAPMAFAFAAAVWWFSGRNGLGGMMAGIGTLIKIFPAVVAIPAMLWETTRHRFSDRRGMMGFALSITAGTAFWIALGGEGVMESLQYHLERGLDSGSLYSGILMIVAKLTGTEIKTIYAYGTTQMITPWSAQVASLTFPIQIASLLLVLWRFWRSKMKDGMRCAAAAVLVFIITGKIFSPQYVIWLFPFIAVLEDRTGNIARPFFLVCCLATTALYPWFHSALLNFDPWAIGLLNLRNFLLLGLLMLLLFGPEERERHPDHNLPEENSYNQPTKS
jgi:hypothetical protein